MGNQSAEKHPTQPVKLVVLHNVVQNPAPIQQDKQFSMVNDVATIAIKNYFLSK